MNILITGAWNDAINNLDAINEMGHSTEFLQYEKDSLPCSYDWVEGVICNGLFLHHPIEKFQNLKYIQLTSAGYDRVPMDYIREHGIEIYNARGVYSAPMAEFALSGVLDLYKQKRYFFQNQKLHLWEKNRNIRELGGKTVCVIGCGSVGSECAKRFKAMECNTIGIDLVDNNSPFFDKVYNISEIKSVLSISDIVIVTIPLTENTKKMFNENLFSSMKQDAVFVNIARGGLVDTGAMIGALRNKLSGAVLDVFEEEPLSDTSPLWDMENVIITPHNSFVGDAIAKRLGQLIYGNLEK